MAPLPNRPILNRFLCHGDGFAYESVLPTIWIRVGRYDGCRSLIGVLFASDDASNQPEHSAM